MRSPQNSQLNTNTPANINVLTYINILVFFQQIKTHHKQKKAEKES